MAEPPFPPPGSKRPFDWRHDDPVWDDSHRKFDERVGLLFVVFALLALAVGFWLLLTIH